MNVYNWNDNKINFVTDWINTLLNLYLVKQKKEKNEQIRKQCYIIPNINISL